MLRLVMVIFFMSLPFMKIMAQTEQDKDSIRRLLAEYVSAFNHHDPHKMASFWTEDGDLITVWGQLATNRTDVEKILRKNNEEKLKNSTLEESIEFMRFVTPDVAVIDVDRVIFKMLDPHGKEMTPQTSHGFYVVVKRNNKWQIVAFRSYVLKELLF